MNGIQQPRYSAVPAPRRSYRYYAVGAAVHLVWGAAAAAWGYGWFAMPLLVAAVLAIVAVREKRRHPSPAVSGPRPPRIPPTVLHSDQHSSRR